MYLLICINNNTLIKFQPNTNHNDNIEKLSGIVYLIKLKCCEKFCLREIGRKPKTRVYLSLFKFI